MASTFDVQRRVIDDYVTNALCIHVHGSLGQYHDGTFGSFTNLFQSDLAIRGALGIKIIHEENAVTAEFDRARAKLKAADRIFFLGFGFHKTNMHRLHIQQRRKIDFNTGVMGTHKGIKAKAWAAICRENNFSGVALRYGAGSISNFLNEALQIEPSGFRII